MRLLASIISLIASCCFWTANQDHYAIGLLISALGFFMGSEHEK